MYYPIISVIITPNNNEEYLCDAIDSVIKQSYPHWEIIIVYTELNQSLLSIIKEYMKQDSRIHCYNIPHNQEQPNAIYTTGISKARGEWISFLSAEDMYTQDRFATLIEHTFTRPDIQMFHTSYIIRDEVQSTILGVSFPEGLTIPQLFSPLSFMKNTTLSLSTIFVHRNACTPLPHVPPNIKYAYLFSLFMTISRTTKTGYINTITCHHRHTHHSSALTLTDKDLAKKTNISTSSIAPYDIQFDTGTMCVTMLHSYSLQELAPYLYSDNISIYQSFISNVLSIALCPQSLLYACGLHTLLLERFLEWLSNDVPAIFKKKLHEYASTLILADFSSIPLALQEICSKIVHTAEGSYEFTPDPLRVILARSGAEILRTSPSIAMLYMNYCQKTVPDIYSNMLLYFHDAPVQNTTVLQRPLSMPLDQSTQGRFQPSQGIAQ